jgi:hypothetical protein
MAMISHAGNSTIFRHPRWFHWFAWVSPSHWDVLEMLRFAKRSIISWQLHGNIEDHAIMYMRQRITRRLTWSSVEGAIRVAPFRIPPLTKVMVSLSLQSFPEQIISCDCFTSMVPMNLRWNMQRIPCLLWEHVLLSSAPKSLSFLSCWPCISDSSKGGCDRSRHAPNRHMWTLWAVDT